MRLEEILSPIRHELVAFDSVLEDVLKRPYDPDIKAVLTYLYETPGKRLRPVLFYLWFMASSGGAPTKEQQKKAHLIAASLELIHMASLVHDDIIDSAELRHNKPSIQAKWGTPVSVAMGVYLYSFSLQLIAEAGSLDVLRCISHTVKGMCEGELFQVFERGQTQLAIRKYLMVLKKKTGILFAAACESGVYLSDNTARVSQARSFGLNLGMVYQLLDDYLDIMGDEETLGKGAGQDVDMGAATMPLLYLCEESSPEALAEIQAKFSTPSSESLAWLQGKIRASQAPVKMQRLGRHFLSKTRAICSDLPESVYKASLLGILAYMEARGGEALADPDCVVLASR